MIYNVALGSSIQLSDSVIYIFFRFISVIDYYKIMNIGEFLGGLAG